MYGYVIHHIGLGKTHCRTDRDLQSRMIQEDALVGMPRILLDERLTMDTNEGGKLERRRRNIAPISSTLKSGHKALLSS